MTREEKILALTRYELPPFGLNAPTVMAVEIKEVTP